MGYWWPKNNSLYFLSVSPVVAILFLYILQETIEVVIYRNNWEKVVEVSFIMLPHYAELYKIISFVSKRKQVRTLLDSLNQEYFQPRNKEELKILQNTVQKCRIIFICYILVSFFTCLFWAVVPLLDSDVEPYTLPLRAYFPINTDHRFWN